MPATPTRQASEEHLQDFEKLGAFYLGKRLDTGSDQLTDEVVLYDAKDLTTHAVIISMTGSGQSPTHAPAYAFVTPAFSI